MQINNIIFHWKDKALWLSNTSCEVDTLQSSGEPRAGKCVRFSLLVNFENRIHSNGFSKIRDPCACYCYDTTIDIQVIRKVWHIYKNKKKP